MPFSFLDRRDQQVFAKAGRADLSNGEYFMQSKLNPRFGTSLCVCGCKSKAQEARKQQRRKNLKGVSNS